MYKTVKSTAFFFFLSEVQHVVMSSSLCLLGGGGWVHTESWGAERKEDHEAATEDQKWNTTNEEGWLMLRPYFQPSDVLHYPSLKSPWISCTPSASAASFLFSCYKSTKEGCNHMQHKTCWLQDQHPALSLYVATVWTFAC